MQTKSLLRTAAGFATLASAMLFQSCGSFSSNPPLPQQASIEHSARPTAETDFNAIVPNADIVYFPSDRAVFGSRAEPAALLLDAMQRTTAPFAIAWDLIDVTQQPLLDQLPAATNEAARESIIRKLDIGGSGRAREHCRSVLRDRRFAAVRQIALRWPAELAAKLAAAQPLSPDEERALPHGFNAPPFEVAANRPDLRVHVLEQQFSADQIVSYFNEAGGTGKLLVFLQPQDLTAGQGVPFYVGQKARLRQMVLDSAANSRAPGIVTQL
ncbi:MAG: hypothetical protein M3Y80_09530 [Verrucomicrobiota bacterium]|nr:hypothetical protein [Verrucomicrobiota bacterium]